MTVKPRRLTAPRMEPPQPGETPAEAQQRQRRNRAAKEDWLRLLSARCVRCGQTNGYVVHEMDPATAPEGPEYYASFADQLHEFEPDVALTTVGGTDG